MYPIAWDTAYSSLQTLLLHGLIQSFIIVMFKTQFNYWFFCAVGLSAGINCSGGWVEWLRLAACLSVSLLGHLPGPLLGACQTSVRVSQHSSQSICQGISWSVCCRTARMSVETSLGAFFGASVRASVEVSVELSFRASINLNCIMHRVILSS